MRPPLPETLGREFWFSLFMVGLCGLLGLLGYLEGSGYQISVSVLLGAFDFYQMVVRFREVRLARALKRHPDMARIYYDPDH